MVLVNFHSEHLLVERVRRLAGRGHPVVIADNSGTFPSGNFATGTVDVVDTGANVGFAAACNAAVSALPPSARTVCLHNPDVDIDPADLDRLAVALHRQKSPGVTAPVEHQGTVRRTRGYAYPAPWREAVLAALAFGPGPGPGAPDTRAGRPPEALPVRRQAGTRGRRFAGGSVWLLDRDAFEAVGGFDERYFLYAEDLDLWHRLSLAGRTTAFCPDAVAHHRSGEGSPMAAAARELLRWAGVELFAHTFEPAPVWRRMRRVHRAWLPAARGRAPELAARLQTLWDGGVDPVETQALLRAHLGERTAGRRPPAPMGRAGVV